MHKSSSLWLQSSIRVLYNSIFVPYSGAISSRCSLINSSFFYSGKRATNLEGFNTIYSLGYMWFSAFGASVTILVGILVSLFTKGLSTFHEVDKQLLIFDFNSIFKNKNKKKEANFQINCSYERDEAINYF